MKRKFMVFFLLAALLVSSNDAMAVINGEGENSSATISSSGSVAGEAVMRRENRGDGAGKRQMQESVRAVSLGGSHSAAITENGDLYCWGWNNYGQVGNGTANNQYTPVKVLENVIEVSLGRDHSAAITRNGDLYCWGSNEFGKVGNGTETDQYTPVKVLGNVVEVLLGEYRSAAITGDGDLYCWGDNFFGQVGNGTTTNQYTPVKVLENVKAVSLGNCHSAAITKSGDLYCWGLNNCGQVGNGTATDQYTPEMVLENAIKVSLGASHSAAITGNGDLYCWGDNSYGEVGNGMATAQYAPEKVLENITQVCLGYYHTGAITRNGDLYCWGMNGNGQVGGGTTFHQYTPEKVMENVNTISMGYYYSAAITGSGELYCWGDNHYGQVGNGATIDQCIPEKVLENVAQVSLEYEHSAAITRNGDLYCWGWNNYGQAGNGTITDYPTQLTPVKVSVDTATGEDIPSAAPYSVSFTIDTSVEATLGEEDIRVSCKVTLEGGAGISYEGVKSEAKGISWQSSDTSILDVDVIQYQYLDDTNTVLVYVYVTPKKTGTAMLIGTTLDGQIQSCAITVTEELAKPSPTLTPKPTSTPISTPKVSTSPNVFVTPTPSFKPDNSSVPSIRPNNSSASGTSSEPNISSTVAPEQFPDDTEEPPASEDANVKNGKKYTVNGLVYQYKSGSLTLVGVSNSSNMRILKIPAQVTISGKKYPVKAIASNVCKGDKKVQQVELSKNIAKIGKNSFSNCKHLWKIVIRSTKLTSKTIGKNVFRKPGGNAKKQVHVYLPEKKSKSYKKILQARGISADKKVRIRGRKIL